MALEHDASLVHANAAHLRLGTEGEEGGVRAPFAPTGVDRALLWQLLHASPRSRSGVSLEDLCEVQMARFDAAGPLGRVHAFMAKSELALMFEVFGVMPEKVGVCEGEGENAYGNGRCGGSLEVPKLFLRQWLGEERLPEGWSTPEREVDLWRVLARVREINKVHKRLGDGDNAKTTCCRWGCIAIH